MNLKSTSLLCIILCCLHGCGGGGGGSDAEINIKGADVTVDAEPQSIGLGDRISVAIKISNVDENGVILKVRMPKQLRLVTETSFLKEDDDVVSVDPFEDSVGADGLRYMGYYFPRSSFDDERRAELTFEVRALTAPGEGDLEVDSDVHNPAKDADQEFSARRGFFSKEDSEEIVIK